MSSDSVRRNVGDEMATSPDRVSGTAEEIDVATAHAMWHAGDTVIDVRRPEEYADGHITGAVNIPIRDLPTRAASLPRGQVVTVCSTGIRGGRAAETLARLGRTAHSIRGGTDAWAAAGHPVTSGPSPGHRRHAGRWWSLRRR